MSNGEVKYKVTADGTGAATTLNNVGTALNGANAKAESGAGLWNADTAAMKGAAVAVRGFFSALGVIGAVLGGINMVISLWRQLNDLIGRGAAEAEAQAKQKADELKEAEAAAARQAEEHFRKARAEAEKYIETLKEAARLEDRKGAASARVRNARAKQEEAEIDKAVAEGRMDKASAAVEKERVGLLAQRDNLEAEIERKKARLAQTRTASDSATFASVAATVEEDQLGKAKDEAFEKARNLTAANRKKKGVGWIAAGEMAKAEEKAWGASAKAEADYDAAKQRTAEAGEAARIAAAYAREVENEVNPELEALTAELAALGTLLAANDAKSLALAAPAAEEPKKEDDEGNGKGGKGGGFATKTVEAPVDSWTRIGAYTGHGGMNDRQLQIAMRSMTLQERSNTRLGQILEQLRKMEATT